MATTVSGRHTHRHDGADAMCRLRIRVNRPLAARTWLPALAPVPGVLRELTADPALGLLGYTRHLSARGALVMQYWRDLDALIEYAQSAARVRRPAWAEFNRRARQPEGTIGIWHETLVAATGGHESVYVDMPAIGLAAAYGSVPASGQRQAARGRFAATAA